MIITSGMEKPALVLPRLTVPGYTVYVFTYVPACVGPGESTAGVELAGWADQLHWRLVCYWQSRLWAQLIVILWDAEMSLDPIYFPESPG